MYVRRTKGWPSKAERIPGGGIRFRFGRVTLYRLQALLEEGQTRARVYEVSLDDLYENWQCLASAKLVDTSQPRVRALRGDPCGPS